MAEPETKLFHVGLYAIVHEDGASTPAESARANLDILVDALTPEDAMARVARALTLLANSRP